MEPGQSWVGEGGLTQLAKIFDHSYTKDDSYNNWCVGASPLVCCYPDNNPLERHNQEIKGTQQCEGFLCEVGKSMAQMFLYKCPKLVCKVSTCAHVGRVQQVESEGLGSTLSKRYSLTMAYAKHVHPKLDIHTIGDKCFCMNTCFSLQEQPLEQHRGPRNYSSKLDTDMKEPHEMDNEQHCNNWKGWLSLADIQDHRYVLTERIDL